MKILEGIQGGNFFDTVLFNSSLDMPPKAQTTKEKKMKETKKTKYIKLQYNQQDEKTIIV